MSVLCEQAPRLLPSFTAAECHFTASVLARTTLCSSAEQAAQQQAAAEARPKRAAPVAARADPVALQWPELVRGALWGCRRCRGCLWRQAGRCVAAARRRPWAGLQVAGGDADAEVLALLAAHLDGVVERAAGGARAGSSQPVSARRACAARDGRLPCTPHKRGPGARPAAQRLAAQALRGSASEKAPVGLRALGPSA